MRAALLRFCGDDSGVTAIEYGLIAFLVSVSIIGAVSATGQSLLGFYTFVSDQLAAVAP